MDVSVTLTKTICPRRLLRLSILWKLVLKPNSRTHRIWLWLVRTEFAYSPHFPLFVINRQVVGLPNVGKSSLINTFRKFYGNTTGNSKMCSLFRHPFLLLLALTTTLQRRNKGGNCRATTRSDPVTKCNQGGDAFPNFSWAYIYLQSLLLFEPEKSGRFSQQKIMMTTKI